MLGLGVYFPEHDERNGLEEIVGDDACRLVKHLPTGRYIIQVETQQEGYETIGEFSKLIYAEACMGNCSEIASGEAATNEESEDGGLE